MAAESREHWKNFAHAGRILGLAFPLFATAGPVFGGTSATSAWCECDARPAAYADVAERAVRRVEQFLVDIQEGRFERALDHLVGNNPDKDQSGALRELLGTVFRAYRQSHGPSVSFDRIGLQETGPYVVRANYLLRTEETGVATTFVMSRMCDDWILEHFALAE